MDRSPAGACRNGNRRPLLKSLTAWRSRPRSHGIHHLAHLHPSRWCCCPLIVSVSLLFLMSIIAAHLNLCAVRLKALSRQLAAAGPGFRCKEYLAAGPVPLKFADAYSCISKLFRHVFIFIYFAACLTHISPFLHDGACFGDSRSSERCRYAREVGFSIICNFH